MGGGVTAMTALGAIAREELRRQPKEENVKRGGLPPTLLLLG